MTTFNTSDIFHWMLWLCMLFPEMNTNSSYGIMVPYLQSINILFIYFFFYVVKPESADVLSEFGMSCIGVSIEQLFAHTEHLAQEIQYFRCEY